MMIFLFNCSLTFLFLFFFFMTEKYTHQEYGMPGSSVMCDVVRCLITCADPDDLKKVFNLICSNFQVIRVKNGFAERTVPFGFRQLLMNVLHSVGEGKDKVTMVCEVRGSLLLNNIISRFLIDL